MGDAEPVAVERAGSADSSSGRTASAEARGDVFERAESNRLAREATRSMNEVSHAPHHPCSRPVPHSS